MTVRRPDGTWGPMTAWTAELGADGLGANDATRSSAAGIVAAHLIGRAVRDASGRARTVVEFSGDEYDGWINGKSVKDPVICAFIDPATGSLNHAALEEAAKLLLAAQKR